jgi:hypothetical protein
LPRPVATANTPAQRFVALFASKLPETMPCKATSTTTLRRFSNAVDLY